MSTSFEILAQNMQKQKKTQLNFVAFNFFIIFLYFSHFNSTINYFILFFTTPKHKTFFPSTKFWTNKEHIFLLFYLKTDKILVLIIYPMGKWLGE